MHIPNALFAPDRLASLHQRHLMDAPKDPALDRVTEFVARMLRAPVALLTLVDRDRQFFLSNFGLSGLVACARQTPIRYSFCQYVVAHGEPFIVNDARVHPLVRSNPATRELNVVAYAGVPLITPDGKTLGALSAVDIKPRQWKPKDMELLNALAAHVVTELELRAKKAELGKELRTWQVNETERLTAARLTVHDLRTPLTGLLLSLEMLPQMGTLTKDQEDLISMCLRTGAALKKLIDDLLEIHALERGDMFALHWTSVAPSRLADQAIEQVRALAANKSIELTPIVMGEVRDVEVDDEKITRVLVNLLANGIKFTTPGGRVGTSITMTGESDSAAIVFAVKDTGLGIKTSDARRIFNQGLRLNESASIEESAGLGLTYCKRIIEAHGGSIWLESVYGKGSTFFIRIPCRGLVSHKSLFNSTLKVKRAPRRKNEKQGGEITDRVQT